MFSEGKESRKHIAASPFSAQFQSIVLECSVALLGPQRARLQKETRKIDLTLEEVPSSPGIPGSQGTATFTERVLGTGWWAAFFYNHSQHWLSPGCLPGPALSAVFPLFISANPRNSTKGKVILFSSVSGALRHRLWAWNALRVTVLVSDMLGP